MQGTDPGTSVPNEAPSDVDAAGHRGCGEHELRDVPGVPIRPPGKGFTQAQERPAGDRSEPHSLPVKMQPHYTGD